MSYKEQSYEYVFKNIILIMANVFNLSQWSPTSDHFHSLKIDNCDSYLYSRLIVHEDLRLKRVNMVFFCSIYFLILRHRSVILLLCGYCCHLNLSGI